MAKRRPRGQAREVSRAEMKAYERRAASVGITEPPARESVTGERHPLDDAPRATAAPRGVLPPRVSRTPTRAPGLTREQELAYIRVDLRRLVILTAGITVALFLLALVMPMLNL